MLTNFTKSPTFATDVQDICVCCYEWDATLDARVGIEHTGLEGYFFLLGVFDLFSAMAI